MVCVVGAGSPELALSGLRLFIAGAHAAYYGFSAIYWQAAGYSASAVGYLWSLGVVAEVIIFALSNKLFRRCSARDMLLISAICGVVRWGIMGSNYGVAVVDSGANSALRHLHGLPHGRHALYCRSPW